MHGYPLLETYFFLNFLNAIHSIGPNLISSEKIFFIVFSFCFDFIFLKI